MPSTFRVYGLNPADFTHLFDLDDTTLAERGIVRTVAAQRPGYPCRVSLRDAEVGEEVLLLPYRHHRASTPYRSEGPIYVRRNAVARTWTVGEVPRMLRHRTLSLRAYDEGGMMRRAVVESGERLEDHLTLLFSDARVAYVHVHNAGPGCFNCEVRRAPKCQPPED